jgi:uncharacterized membrane protein YfcA
LLTESPESYLIFSSIFFSADMEWYIYLLIIAAGVVAGFINTVAGSGSLLTLPLLMFIGLPAVSANGTNRVGILFQTIVSTASFKRQKILNIRTSIELAVPAVLGSLIGALIAVDMNEEMMERAIGGLLIVMFFIILIRPSRWTGNKEGNRPVPFGIRMGVFFLIGIYGGFIQAGVGFFLIAGLVLGAGYDLVKANAVKSFIILLFTLSALVIFIYNHQVEYLPGIILAIGNMIGAYLAARFSVQWGPVVIRYILLVTLLLSSVKLLNVF